MRRRLYDFFGLPQLPDSEPAEGFNEALPVEVTPDPIHIPKPVRKFERKPVKELRFHDLGSKRWIEWASAQQGLPHRGLRYIRPDDMHRLPLDAISTRLHQGDVCIVDLSSLAHMDSQRSALSRQVQDMANYGASSVCIGRFQSPVTHSGSRSRIDTETHELGGNSIID